MAVTPGSIALHRTTGEEQKEDTVSPSWKELKPPGFEESLTSICPAASKAAVDGIRVLGVTSFCLRLEKAPTHLKNLHRCL